MIFTYFLLFVCFIFQTPHIKWNQWYLSLLCLTYFHLFYCNTFQGHPCGCERRGSPFLRLNRSVCVCVCVCAQCICISQFIHSSIDGHFVFMSWLHWTQSYRSFWISLSSSLDKYSEVALLEHTVVLFLFWKEVSILFSGDCTNLHSHPQCTRVPFYSHSTNTCYLLSFWLIAMLTGVRWCIIIGFDFNFP